MHACLGALSLQWYVTPCTVAHQALLFMRFSSQEYWSGLPCSPPGDLPDPGMEPVSLTLPALASRFFYHEHHLGSHHLRRQMTNALTVVVQSWQRLYMLSCWGFFCCCFWHQTFFLLCWFLLQIIPFPIVYERWKFQFQKLSLELPLLSNTGWQSEHDLTLA